MEFNLICPIRFAGKNSRSDKLEIKINCIEYSTDNILHEINLRNSFKGCCLKWIKSDVLGFSQGSEIYQNVKTNIVLK